MKLEYQTGTPVPPADDHYPTLPADLEAQLARQVVGQDGAVRAVSEAIRRALTGPPDPRRPLGVFLFVGPDGAGKTALARALASTLFGSAESMVCLYMSQFTEMYDLERLVGTTSGYPDHRAGQLMAALGERPHGLLLLDEIEKAHPAVLDIFLRLFDGGRLTDAQGRLADGCGAFFVMTSVAGTEAYALDGRAGSARDALAADRWRERQECVERAVQAAFTSELLRRVDRIVYFQPLSPDCIRRVFDLLISRVQRRLAERWRARLSVTPAAREYICGWEYDPLRGARALDRAIDVLLLGPVARHLLADPLPEGGALVADYDGHEIVVRRGE